MGKDVGCFIINMTRVIARGEEIKAEIKSLDEKLTPKNSLAEFPSLKNPTMD